MKSSRCCGSFFVCIRDSVSKQEASTLQLRLLGVLLGPAGRVWDAFHLCTL